MEEPAAIAKSAGLRYVDDSSPGIRRRRAGRGFRYLDADDKPVGDESTIERINALAIPPAWSDVWICPRPNGHIQATGRDVRGRKQYRYHDRWREVRDAAKYERMLGFGAALPRIREQIDSDLRRKGLVREKVVAAVVALLDQTLIRVGNQEYARDNQSFGLTTMRDRHVKIEGGTIHFEFRGKSGKDHSVDLSDRRLARVVKRCQEIPGYDLFQYFDDDGERHTVESGDVNSYLQEVSGAEYTAKDFRTWAGTVTALLALEQEGPFGSQTEARRKLSRAIEQVAAQLGNTPAVSRSSYIHPAVLELYLRGGLFDALTAAAERAEQDGVPGLEPEEARVIPLIEGAADALRDEVAGKRRRSRSGRKSGRRRSAA